MHEERHRIDAQALLTHREFVRALALRLVFDEHRADDVVQETWLAALQHAPARPRSLRAWLARVARNVALKAARTETRRARHERLAKHPRNPGLPVPDAVERLAQERRVVDAVLELEEPYRTTVVLRFYEDLKPTEIARRSGLNAGTVRTRLKRGLDLLRARLDRETGDRRAWCLALLPLLVPQAQATAAVAAPGGMLLMSAKLKLSLAVVFALAAAVGLFGLWAARGSDRGPQRATSAAPSKPAAENETMASAKAPAETADPQKTVAVVVRVEDLASNPLPGARVEVHRSFFPELGVSYSSEDQFYAGAKDSYAVAVATTDATGRATFQHETRQAFLYRAEKEGYAQVFSQRVELRGEAKPDPVTIRLGPAYPLSGRVLDGDGTPIAGAPVLAAHPAYATTVPTYYLPTRTTSDKTGRYRFDNLPGRDVSVWAALPGGVPFRIATLRFPQVGEFDIVLERGGTVLGTVTDADGGAPVPDARVRLMGYFQHRAETYTDARGRYRVDSLPATMLNSIRVQKDGWYQLFDPKAPNNIATRLHKGDTERLDVELRGAPVLRGTVRGPEGPLADTIVKLGNWWTPRGGGSFMSRTDDGGRYAVPAAPGRFVVMIPVLGLKLPGLGYMDRPQEAKGDEPNIVDLPERGELVRDFVLEQAHSGLVEVGGRVVDQKGRPVAKARVWATGGYVDSEPDGTFRLRAKPGDVVRARRSGLSPGRSDPVQPGREVLITLAAGPRLFGDLKLRDGGPLAGAFVLVAHKPSAGDRQELARKYERLWVHATRVAVDPKGHYEARRLAPGRFLVRAGARTHVLSIPIEVVLKEAGEHRLDLELEPGVALRGRVVVVGTRAPVGGVWIRVTPRDPRRRNPYEESRFGSSPENETIVAVTGDDGVFVVKSLATGEYEIRALARDHLESKTVATAGERSVVIELQPALEIRGVVTFANGRPAGGLTVFAERADGERKRSYSPGTSGDGRFVVPRLAPGSYRVTVGGRRARASTTEPVEAGRKDLRLVVEQAAPGEEGQYPQTQEGDASLQGRIVDPSGKGIGGVRIYAAPMSKSRSSLGRSTRSSANGQFVLRGLAAKPHRVRALFDGGGWLEQFKENVVPGNEPLTFVFASLAGVIRGDDVAGREIRARPLPHDKDKGRRTAVVAEDGRFEITGLPPGRYDLVFKVEKERPHLLLEGGGEVTAGKRDLMLRATKGALLAGMVLDEDGRPLVGATVRAWRGTPREGARMRTGKAGRFQLSGLRRAKTYDVTVFFEKRVPAKRRVKAPASGLRFVIETGFKATGRLVDANGKPCVMTQLRFVPSDPDAPEAHAETDVEGRFTVSGLRDGEYRAEAWPKVVLKAGDPWPKWQPVGKIRARARDIELKTPGPWR